MDAVSVARYRVPTSWHMQISRNFIPCSRRHLDPPPPPPPSETKETRVAVADTNRQHGPIENPTSSFVAFCQKVDRNRLLDSRWPIAGRCLCASLCVCVCVSVCWVCVKCVARPLPCSLLGSRVCHSARWPFLWRQYKKKRVGFQLVLRFWFLLLVFAYRYPWNTETKLHAPWRPFFCFLFDVARTRNDTRTSACAFSMTRRFISPSSSSSSSSSFPSPSSSCPPSSSRGL